MAQHLVGESQFFIEWAVLGINLETDIAFASDLVDLQRLLSRWKLGWAELWANEVKRQEMATLAQQWCVCLGRVELTLVFTARGSCWRVEGDRAKSTASGYRTTLHVGRP